jgi:hypothetical protein
VYKVKLPIRGSVVKGLLIIVPLVVTLTLVSLFMPARRVSIEGVGKVSFETTVTLSVGSEVAYASPAADISVPPPTSYNFGVVAAGSTPITGLTYFTVTNNGLSAVNITISGTDMTGGGTWALSDTAEPGDNIVGFKTGKASPTLTVGRSGGEQQPTVGRSGGEQQPVVGFEGQGDYTIIIKKTGPGYNYLIKGLPAGASIKWGLKMWTPTSFSDSEQKTGIITLTAYE